MEQMEIQKIDFLIESKTKSNSRSEISVRNFKVMVDEPEPLGGTDLAPNPVEYILCGLSGCIHILAFKIAHEKDCNIRILLLDPLSKDAMRRSDDLGFSKNTRFKARSSSTEPRTNMMFGFCGMFQV